HVGINLYGMVHDLYYPHVGLENHAAAKNMRHRIGVWVENSFSWLDDGNWEFKMAYDPHGMIGHTTAHNERLQVTLELTDCVDWEWDVFLRNIHVINGTNQPREIRLFLHQMLLINHSLNPDTAQYLPEQKAVIHYKGRRSFLAGGKDAAGNPFNQFSIGIFGLEGHDGVYRDAEDGILSGNPVEFGQVDSVFGFNLHLDALESTRVSYWLCAARLQPQALKLHETLLKTDIHDRFARTAAHWRRWLEPAEKHIVTFPKEWQTPFRNSLLLVKAAIDHQGGVIASTDTTQLNYNRDAYTYCWPRDGAYALWPLVRLGYKTELKNFFAFSRQGLDPDGFLHHKYQPDVAIGSSWHPYIVQGRVIAPMQEDETAIVAFLFCEYMRINRDRKVFDEFYDSLLVPMCNFMAGYIDPQTKLPHASYDLWEEKFLTHTYTVALVYAALAQSAELAARYKKHADAVRWQTCADDIKMAAHLLYRPEQKSFCKGFINRGDAKLEYDDTVDSSSVYGARLFGLFAPDSTEITESLATLRTMYNFQDEQPTVVGRYKHDSYYVAAGSALGNPWFITSLWMAEFDMAEGNIARAKRTINWVAERMLSTGVLSEQFNEFNLKFLSVAPLTWSQAEFMTSVLDIIEVHEKH
ncbi:MAG TPA: glycoside hydrolase family 15 protein, partial [Magnetospirillaceae bacterium]|nr:glycoside hydrolase family 15 protein [Magnetospirillaceae bacterium]